VAKVNKEKVKAKVNKEKVKAAYKKDLVSLEILQVPQNFKDETEAEDYYNATVKHKYYIIDDLSKPYLIRLSYSENKKEIRSIDPEFIPEGDQYELSESVQDILRENMFPVIKSDFPQKEENEKN